MLATSEYLVNWEAGWGLILAGSLSGALLGLGFHRDDFWGGYVSFRRRLARLGHIALVALGGINVLFSVSMPHTRLGQIASTLLLTGGIAMPTVCFLTAWRERFRHAFFIPVVCLVSSVVLVLLGGSP